jgi:predicted enzyme related to lactoylglutathione lyase
MSIKKIGMSIVAVSDIGKAKHYYSQVLGLAINFEKNDYLEVRSTDQTILPISKESKEENFEAGKNAPINLIVDDIHKTKAELEAKGVIFLTDIINLSDYLKLALFEDPDKNKFFIIEKLS